jgi:hypothetical protein
LSTATAANLRVYYQILDLSKALNLHTIILTFEGHPWERLAFYAARKVNPQIRCIGYQHTVVFPLQHGIKRSLGPAYDPDIVVFAGRYSLEWFLRNTSYTPPIHLVGTPRADVPHPDIFRKYINSLAEPSCLLLPDGTSGECEQFFRLGILCASIMPAVRFVLRFHPVVTTKYISSLFVKFPSFPSNLMISCQSIEYDFTNCNWFIYRASGAGVRAAISGLRPIYFNDPQTNLRIDPLAQFTPWRHEIISPSDVEDTICSDLSLGPVAYHDQYISSKFPASAFFSQYDIEFFANLLADPALT